MLCVLPALGSVWLTTGMLTSAYCTKYSGSICVALSRYAQA